MAHTDETRGLMTCAIELSSDAVDAGAGIALQGRVTCSPACDLRGHTLLVRDQEGADVGTAELTTFAGGVCETDELVVSAPVAAGSYTWTGICPAIVKDGVSFAEASAPIAFNVAAHATNVVAWDVPPAVVAGERFRIKVGIGCSSECRIANRAFEIHDHDGARAGEGRSGDLWPGTTALYVAEVELQAPPEEGLFTWSVMAPASDLEMPHAAGSIRVGVRVVRRPDWLVTIEAVDQETQTPLTGARVVMHPYRAVTDERGVAELRVASGIYRLFVSQTSYLTFVRSVEVTADVTARAELSLEPVPERN